MKLATYTTNNPEAKIGIVNNDTIIELEKLGHLTNENFPKTMLELIDLGLDEVHRISGIITTASENTIADCSILMKEATLLAPIPKPRKNIIGIGLNYTEHVAESARTLDTSNELPQKPVIFSKPPTTVTATNTNILLNPKLTQQLDWECELAVVIGKKGKYVSKEKAMDYVFGYTVINDISARDCRRAGQWIVSKGRFW
jgi:2-keto-4-pentenoate hydratase/2-oxohepta-3-ene-1,7-dioic acid hydratase in catechol pathway